MTTGLNLRSLLRPLLLVLACVIACVGVGQIVVLLQEPEYESTATVGLVPTFPDKETPQLADLGQLVTAAPLYSEAVNSERVRDRVQKLLLAGPVGEIEVSTFRETPLVFKIRATGSTAAMAQKTADAYAEALRAESLAGGVLPAGLAEIRVLDSADLPTGPTRPRPAITLAAGAGVGLLLGGLLLRLRRII